MSDPGGGISAEKHRTLRRLEIALARMIAIIEAHGDGLARIVQGRPIGDAARGSA